MPATTPRPVAASFQQVQPRDSAAVAMSAIEGVSEIFDPDGWDVVPGFEDLTDLTYHRAKAHGTVRIAFDRPDVLNAFRPHTVDELLRRPRARAHVGRRRLRAPHRQRPERRRTASGPSAPAATSGSAAGPATSTRTRQRRRRHRRRGAEPDRQGQARPPAHPRVPAADPLHAEGRHLRRPRLGGRRRAQPARRRRPDARQRASTPASSRPTPTSAPSTAATARPTSPARSARSSPARSSSSADEYAAEDDAPDGHGQPRRPARRAREGRPRLGPQDQRQVARPRSGC